MYCRYTPGFPIVLAAWIRLFGPNAAHYIDPVLFLALLAVHLQISRRVFAAVEGVRWLALGGTLLLLLLPSYLHLWAITILRDILAQLLAATAILLALPRREPMSLRRAAAIGFFLGYLITTRIDAALFALPIGILFLWQRRQRGAIPLAAALFVAGTSPLLGYNYAATGNPLRATQAMELDSFFQTSRPSRAEPAASVAARPRARPATDAAGTDTEPDALRVAAPSPAPMRMAARRKADGSGTVNRPAQPPVQGGGLRLGNLPRTLPGNVRYLRNAFGNVIILLAILGAVAALVTNRLLFVVTVPYCLSALIFYSCWARPDPRYIAGIFVLAPLLALGGLTWLAGVDQMLRRTAGPTSGPLIAVTIAAALAIIWRGELWAPWPIIGEAWEAGGWRGGSALPVVSGVVGLLAIMVTCTGILRRTLARIIHGSCVAKAPSAPQIGPPVDRTGGGILDSTSRSDERSGPERRHTWRLRQRAGEYSATARTDGRNQEDVLSQCVAGTSTQDAEKSQRKTPATESPWLAIALVVLLVATALARAAAGWHNRASFQAAEVERARRTIESIIGPGAVVLTTDEVGRPAENIDYYTHAHALYLRDLERWRLKIRRACRTFLTAGHDVYLLLPTSSEQGRDAREQIAPFDVTHVVHVEARDAPHYFVASRFGAYPLDMYRVSIPAAVLKALGRD